jgi:hypothetical protein
MFGVLAAWVVVDCDRAPARSPNDTNYVNTWSGSLPHPDRLPDPVHTVDNAGFVDNGGRTSDEVNRTQLSGMRPTDLGGQNFAATPASGWPWPLQRGWRAPTKELPAREGEARRTLVPRKVLEGGIPPTVVSAQIAEAECERDLTCAEHGERHDWPTDAKCMAGLRDRERREVEAAGCELGFDAGNVARCLMALRNTPCDVHLDSAADLNDCDAQSLCTAR